MFKAYKIDTYKYKHKFNNKYYGNILKNKYLSQSINVNKG